MDERDLLAGQRAGIATEVAQLRDAVEELAAALRADTRAARVYHVPTLTEDEEAGPPVDVKVLDGAQAREAAAAAITALEYTPFQHPSGSLRRPGVVLVDPAIAAAVERVNDHKRALKARVKAFGRHNWEAWRAHMTGTKHLCLVQAYREIRLLPDVRRVSFAWDRQAATGKEVTVDQLRQLIRRGSRRDPSKVPERVLEAEEGILAPLDPREIVLLRRPTSPMPMANVWRHGSDKPKAMRVSLPLLVPAAADAELPRIRDLVDLEPKDKEDLRHRNDSRVEPEPLIKRVHAYRYKPDFRRRRIEQPDAARFAWLEDRLIVHTEGTDYTVAVPGGRSELAEFYARAIAQPKGAHLGVGGEVSLQKVDDNRTHHHLRVYHREYGVVATVRMPRAWLAREVKQSRDSAR